MVYSDRLSITVKSGLAGSSAYLHGHAESISQDLRKLRADIDHVLEGWKGGANRQFDDLKQEWDMAANGLFNDVLGQIAHAMGLNWRNYEDAEGANAQTWKK
jgi:WXG100 family type VII secretion target